ncbi:putative ER to Golgi transport-related protein, partial [Mycena olivaceomarginata]
VIMFSEFEQQLISEEHLCDTLNNFVAPDLFGPVLLVVLFLVSRNWVACLLNIPVAAYNINKLQTGRHFFGGIKPKVQTRAQRRSIPPALRVSEHKKESFIKIGFYLLSFFYYLYRMIVVLINVD